MADQLLTSLCTICHIQPPKYKCPRCGARTCSLACIKKHKKWSSCNGERDPTVYIPPKKLRTDAGIDHDYNFLTKIERTVERVDKILADEKGIIPNQDHQQHQRPNKRARLHKGSSRGRTTLEHEGRNWDRNCIHRLQDLGIKVTHVPYGMTRSKENNTTWNKRTRSINWQVEWVVINSDEGQPPTRILHKTLDETHLCEAFEESLEFYRVGQLSESERTNEKKTRQRLAMAAAKESQDAVQLYGAGQDPISTAWQAVIATAQTASGSWGDLAIRYGHSLSQKPSSNQQKELQFFYHQPNTPSREAQRLIAVEPNDTLATILPSVNVLEFPTIYVFSSGSTALDGYVVSKLPRAQSRKPPTEQGQSSLVGYGSSDEEDNRIAGGVAEGNQNDELEDGEIDDQQGMALDQQDSPTSSSGSDSEADTDMDDME